MSIMERLSGVALDTTMSASVQAGSGYSDLLPNIDRLAFELSQSKDLYRIVTDGLQGQAWLRDISGYDLTERNEMLQMGRSHVGGPPMVSEDQSHLLDAPRGLLLPLMKKPHTYMQPYAGWNFLVNASGFLESGMPSARLLNASFRDANRGMGIPEIIQDLDDRPHEKAAAHKLVYKVLSDPKNDFPTSYYLAERSEASERHQEKLFGHLMNPSKGHLARVIQGLASESGLSSVHLERTLKQIQITRFSAFDHLVLGVTRGDSDSVGDYHPNTLRVEVKYGGTTSDPLSISDQEASQTLVHELGHSGSAQSADGRCGLSNAKNEGWQVNESMTELLAQMANGFPGIVQDEGQVVSIRSCYPKEVGVLYGIYINDRPSFNTLFNAYFGQVAADLSLGNALRSFYDKYRNLLSKMS